MVRATGGLNDTIDETDGFKFYGYTSLDFLEAVRDAIAEFQDPEGWSRRVRAAWPGTFHGAPRRVVTAICITGYFSVRHSGRCESFSS